MEFTKSFYDLCVPYNKNKNKMIEIIRELNELGYRTIAIEQISDHTNQNEPKKGKDIFPEPINTDFLEEFKVNMKILNRLTIIYSDASITIAINNSANFKKYHLIAGLPTTEESTTHCCTTFPGDILSCDPTYNKLLVNRKSYQLAVKRGIVFEIQYAPIITDSTNRRNMIKIAHNYHAKGKSKNIIFSSRATDRFELRSPYDITNLALILGLTEEQGKSALSSMCRQVYIRAEARRIGKTIMFIKKIGPQVLSSSSCSEDDDDEKDLDCESEMELEKVQSNDKDECDNHPIKKIKLN